jgi:cyclohexanecarboxylate-CoA ligase
MVGNRHNASKNSWHDRVDAMLLDNHRATSNIGSALNAERLAREAKAGFWPDKTILDYFDATVATRPGDRCMTAYRQDAEQAISLSYADMYSRVAEIAAGLTKLGVVHGDVVSFQLPNWWQFLAIHLACVRVGAISNPLMPIFRERELEFMIDRCGAKVLIVPKTFRGFDHEKLAKQLQEKIAGLEHVVVIDGDDNNTFDAIFSGPAAREIVDKQSALQPNDVMKIMYTSGTTGEPKGVMHSSNTILCSLKPVTGRIGLVKNDVIFMPSPFAHSIGFCYGILMSLFLGAELVTLDTWEPATAMEIMERHGVSFMFGATPFLSDLTNLPDVENRKLQSFRTFLTAGAPVPPTLVEQATSALEACILSGFGMTELGLVATVLPEKSDRARDTDGCALPHVDLRVVDAEQQEMTRGTEGELQIRGSSSFVGYYGRPDLYDVDEQGWFPTGDLATMDEDGYIRIVGRSKDIIIRGGENIPVVEVEKLMHEMSQINEVAIVGMPDQRLGERSCAFVSLRDGTDLTLSEVTDFLGSRKLARQYLPEKLIVVDALPKTPAGKIQKFELRERLAKTA